MSGQQDPAWEKYHRTSSRYNSYNNGWGQKFQRDSYNFSRRDKFYNIYSAGVIPYTYTPHRKLMFLLGKDGEGQWSDFGGRVEIEDNDDPAKTASREFYEESMGSIIDSKECYIKLTQGSPMKITSKTLNGSPYYMYFLYIDCKDWGEIFNKTYNFLKYSNAPTKIFEKTQIRWISLETIVQAIDNKSHLAANSFIPLRKVFYDTISNCKEEIISLDSTQR
mgnify:CR=1 FL=1